MQLLCSEPLWPVPDLQPFAPRAHVLAQEQVVECSGTDDVKLLFEHLSDDFGIVSMLEQSRVE